MEKKNTLKSKPLKTKPLFTINILIGLPGSGKSTFGNKMVNNQRAILIRFDDYIKDGKMSSYDEIWKDRFRYQTFYGPDFLILDGLFLTNSSRKSVIQSLIDYVEHKKINNGYCYRIIYHFWNEDRETCLHNDKGRRSVDSSVTIKNAPYEPVDVDYIEKDIKDYVFDHQIKNHTVARVTVYDKFFQSYGTASEPDIMKSEEWSLGGTSGDYGIAVEMMKEQTPDFVEFDELIEQVCPNISYIQYKNVYRRCVIQKTRSVRDYYGGYEEKAWWECNLKELYKILLEKGLITED